MRIICVCEKIKKCITQGEGTDMLMPIYNACIKLHSELAKRDIQIDKKEKLFFLLLLNALDSETSYYQPAVLRFVSLHSKHENWNDQQLTLVRWQIWSIPNEMELNNLIWISRNTQLSFLKSRIFYKQVNREIFQFFFFTLFTPMLTLHRNQSITLQLKSIDWFLCSSNIGEKRVNKQELPLIYLYSFSKIVRQKHWHISRISSPLVNYINTFTRTPKRRQYSFLLVINAISYRKHG